MAVVTELVTKFTFKGSIKPLQDFNATLGKSLKLIAGTATAIGLGAIGLGTFIESTLKAAQGQNRLATETGISIEKIQELGYAASVTGSSAQALESTFAGLSQKIGQAAQTGSADFARLGISVRDAFGNVKKADQVLAEVGQRFKELNLSNPQKQNIASSLGIDSTLITMLSKSNAEMNNLRETARKFGVVTKQQSIQVEQFNNSITTLKFGLNSLKTQLAISLSPQMKEITEQFTGWLLANKDLIRYGLERVTEVIVSVFKAIVRLGTFIDDVIKATIGWKVAFIALGVVLALTLSPVYLITAAIVAALVVIDDLIVAFKGGKSVIRDFFLEFFGFDITPVLKGLVEGFKGAVKVIKTVFVGLFSWITAAIDGVIKSIEFVKSIFSDDNKKQDENSTEKKSPLSLGMKPADMQQFSKSSTSNNKSINQTIKIDIKATDPESAGKAVVDSLQNQLQSANAQLGMSGA